MSHARYLRARIVWPVASPPVEDGAVLVRDGRFVAVGTSRAVPCPAGVTAVDLGEAILLPGLVNAHCHLDYTHMAGQIAPTSSFTDWIKCITTLKQTWSTAEFRDSWLAGAEMLVRRGVTLVGDVEAVPDLLPDVWFRTPLRGISFLEMTGVKSRRDPAAIVDEAVTKAAALHHDRWRVGLSPHAPYSTVPALLEHSGRAARARGWRLTTHVAESSEEYEMFVHGRGPLYEWLARNERDMSDCGGISPVRHLERHDLLGDDVVLVHANLLEAEDAERMARRGAHVVHCPRSHAYFDHRPFARPGLERAGVNLCLGTDSLATVHRRSELVLDLFAEMRELLAHDPGVTPDTVVRMATLHGARALGFAGLAGVLAAGAWADAIALPFIGAVEATAEAVVHHEGEVAASMIAGEWTRPPGG